MANLHHRVKDPSHIQSVLSAFLTKCRKPAVLEEGDELLPLRAGEYQLEIRRSRCYLETLGETRVLSRQITGITDEKPGVLTCTTQRFGGAEGRLTVLDLDRPQTAHRQLVGARQNFGTQFRRMLQRQFPQWEISSLSSSMDLRRSFSPVFPRARLIRGPHVLAAMACPTTQNEAHFLTFALLWFHHLLESAKSKDRLSLCLFLPDGAGGLTAHRLRWLQAAVLQTRLFKFNSHGLAGEVDLNDLGNLETRVTSHFSPAHLTATLQSMLDSLAALPHISCNPELQGGLSIQVQGTEFARIENQRVLLGIHERREVGTAHLAEVRAFALHLLELSGSRDAPSSSSERWLEGIARVQLTTIYPDLLPDLIHGQVLTYAAGDRDAIDLLAASPDGRLTVLELKTSEDIQLPLQALDYWARIRWHAEQGELAPLFPTLPLSTRPPRLALVAPALSFHSTLPTVLRYFSPEVEVERIGVSSDWQTRFRVVLRLSGADIPLSHGRDDGLTEPFTHP